MTTVYTPGGPSNFGALPAMDRLVRKEVSLGRVRELPVDTRHIGLAQIAPWLEVGSDDVIFDYVKDIAATGLAPARAEDAESTLAKKDDAVPGSGRASIIDWAEKDVYTASDVTRYREYLQMAELAADGQLPLTLATTPGADFAAKLARDETRRRARLDNRIEWLITTGLAAGKIAYNDGKLLFEVDYGRPTAQHQQAPASGTYASDTHDPINDILAIQEKMYDTYGITVDKAVCSKKFLLAAARSAKFGFRVGYVPDGSGGIAGISPSDAPYIINNWSPQAAIDLLKQQTGIEFIEHDGVYRTRNIGSTTAVNNRFWPRDEVVFFPSEAQLGEIDDSQIGFAKTLTSPHAEGGFTPGFYEWEQEKRDPWQTERGTGVKAFPVFLHLDKTFSMKVTLPA